MGSKIGKEIEEKIINKVKNSVCRHCLGKISHVCEFKARCTKTKCRKYVNVSNNETFKTHKSLEVIRLLIIGIKHSFK